MQSSSNFYFSDGCSKISFHDVNYSIRCCSKFHYYIPANSHALGVSLTPAGSKLRSHAGSRLIEKCELLPSCLKQFPKMGVRKTKT